MPRVRQLAAKRTVVLFAIGLLATACSADESATDEGDPSMDAEAVALSDPSPDDGVESPSFPVTIEHFHGTTTIDAEPQRVVTYGFADHSYVLELGVVPVALRKQFEAQSFLVYPWAAPPLESAQPELLDAMEPSFEQIAALAPDLILAVNVELEDREYEILSSIAPTVARLDAIQTEPWRGFVAHVARAIGRVEEGELLVAELEALFAETRAANPHFTESTASIAYSTAAGAIGSYDADNSRYQFLGELGFTMPSELAAAADGEAVIVLGAERLDLLDADVVIWSPDRLEDVQNIPTREVTAAARDRREVVVDPILTAALSESSPLSWRYALERIVPELILALDGDPGTVGTSAQTLYGLAGDTATAQEQAAMDAWFTAMDPSVPLELRRPHIADFDEIESVLDQAVAAAQALGGSEVRPERASIVGDVATVSFTAVLGETEAPGLLASLDLVDGTWVARRDEVCGFLAFVDVTCPG
ncbi:MAG: ABC transporter substrate-binding protein [Actinomycetota bacterium]